MPVTPTASVPSPAAASPAPPIESLLPALATLRDIQAQADVRHRVRVELPKSRVVIGRDDVRLKVTSERGGYLYVVLLGSDRSSFYLLYPNAFDQSNRIAPKATVTLPGPGWAVRAAGPSGVDEGMVIVADSPRDLQVLPLGGPSSASPFTYAINDAQGRAALVDLFSGRGVSGRAESFGVARFRIEEVSP